jgi:hypothetical protein
MLLDEIPWFMAPASLILATATITLAGYVIRNNNWCFKALAVGAVLALSVGVNIL